MHRFRRRLRAARHGLTLIEIMVVVVIMGMIAGLVTTVVTGRLQAAKVETAKAQIRQFMNALDLFYLDNSFYPSTEQGLEALVTKPSTGQTPTKWPEDGYLPSVPKDPWRRDYVYISPGTNAKYEILCLGRDGQEGGTGYDGDVQSWDLSKAGESG